LLLNLIKDLSGDWVLSDDGAMHFKLSAT